MVPRHTIHLRQAPSQQSNLARGVATLNSEAAAKPLLTELASLAKQCETLTAERADLMLQATIAETDRQKLLDLDQWRRRVANNLDDLDYEERRMVLEALGVVAEVYGADHKPRRVEVRIAPLPVDPNPSAHGHFVFSNPH